MYDANYDDSIYDYDPLPPRGKERMSLNTAFYEELKAYTLGDVVLAGVFQTDNPAPADICKETNQAVFNFTAGDSKITLECQLIDFKYHEGEGATQVVDLLEAKAVSLKVFTDESSCPTLEIDFPSKTLKEENAIWDSIVF